MIDYEEVAAPVWPKYYIHEEQPKNWGVVRYDEKRCYFFKMSEGYKGGPFDWDNCHTNILNHGTWKEVTKEEMVARFDKNPLVDIPPVTPQPPDHMKEIFEEVVWQAVISSRPSGPRTRKVPNRGRRRGGVKG